MGSCQSIQKKIISKKKQDIKEYVDAGGKIENLGASKVIILNGAPGSGKDTQCRLILKKYKFKIITSSELLKNYLETSREKLNADENNNEQTKLTEKEKSDLQLIEKCFSDGSLVPDDIVIRIFTSELNRIIKDNDFDGILINGFPRTYEQALLFKENNVKVNTLINITASRECLWKRISTRLIDPVTKLNYDEKIIELIKKKREGEKLSEEEENLIIESDDHNNLSNEVIARLIKRKDDEESVFDKRFNLYTENEEKILSIFSDICKNVNGDNPISQVFDDITKIIDEALKT